MTARLLHRLECFVCAVSEDFGEEPSGRALGSWALVRLGGVLVEKSHRLAIHPGYEDFHLCDACRRGLETFLGVEPSELVVGPIEGPEDDGRL